MRNLRCQIEQIVVIRKRGNVIRAHQRCVIGKVGCHNALFDELRTLAGTALVVTHIVDFNDLDIEAFLNGKIALENRIVDRLAVLFLRLEIIDLRPLVVPVAGSQNVKRLAAEIVVGNIGIQTGFDRFRFHSRRCLSDRFGYRGAVTGCAAACRRTKQSYQQKRRRC